MFNNIVGPTIDVAHAYNIVVQILFKQQSWNITTYENFACVQQAV